MKNMKRNNRRHYESIMKDVAKKVKSHLNENIDNDYTSKFLDIIDESLDLTSSYEKIANLIEDDMTDEYYSYSTLTNEVFANKLINMIINRINDLVHDY